MNGAIVGVMVYSGVLFVPVFVVALAMLRSVRRAFVLAATFSAGAVIGFFACASLGATLIEVHSSDVRRHFEVVLFATAGGAAGGVLVVWLLGKLTGHPPWRRQ